jgi:hypothetical protein
MIGAYNSTIETFCSIFAVPNSMPEAQNSINGAKSLNDAVQSCIIEAFPFTVWLSILSFDVEKAIDNLIRRVRAGEAESVCAHGV